MQVAFFTDSYPPMRDGVAEITGGLARTLVRLGISVRVFAPQTANDAPSVETEEDGVLVRRIRSVAVPLYGQDPMAGVPLRARPGGAGSLRVGCRPRPLPRRGRERGVPRLPPLRPAPGRHLPHQHSGDGGLRSPQAPRPAVLPGRVVVEPRPLLAVRRRDRTVRRGADRTHGRGPKAVPPSRRGGSERGRRGPVRSRHGRPGLADPMRVPAAAARDLPRPLDRR